MDSPRRSPTGIIRDPGEPLAWPPRPDPKTDPLVFNPRRNTFSTVDDVAPGRNAPAAQAPSPGYPLTNNSAADDALESFTPEESHLASLMGSLRGSEHGTSPTPVDRKPRRVPMPPARAIITTLVVLVLAQAIAVGLLLSRRSGWTTVRVEPPAGVESPPAVVSSAVSAATAPAAPQPRAGERTARGGAPVAGSAAASTPIASSGAATPSEGRLIVSSTPDGATVTVDGRRRGETPLTLERVSAGAHRVQIVRGGTTVEQTVMVGAGGTTSLLVPISSSGWLDVRAGVDLEILEDGRTLGTSSDGALGLSPGAHLLELRNDALGIVTEETVSVVAGEMTRLRPALPDGLLQVNALPWAHVWVDDRQVGDTPLGNLRVPVGQHEIRFQHPDFGEQVRRVVVTASAPARVSVDLR